jgi:hypothetical protein
MTTSEQITQTTPQQHPQHQPQTQPYPQDASQISSQDHRYSNIRSAMTQFVTELHHTMHDSPHLGIQQLIIYRGVFSPSVVSILVTAQDKRLAHGDNIEDIVDELVDSAINKASESVPECRRLATDVNIGYFKSTQSTHAVKVDMQNLYLEHFLPVGIIQDIPNQGTTYIPIDLKIVSYFSVFH